jgi:hypothetical protein
MTEFSEYCLPATGYPPLAAGGRTRIDAAASQCILRRRDVVRCFRKEVKMQLVSRKSRLQGTVSIPASKSHTIRAVAIASLAQGQSLIRNPLTSADAASAVSTYRALGATDRKSVV